MKSILIILILTLQTLAASASTTQTPPLKTKFEIRTAPIAFLAQWLTIDLTYFVSEKWALGPSYVGYENRSQHGGMLSPTYLGTAIGAHFIYADSFFKDSYYAGGHIYSENYRSRPHAFLGYYDNQGSRANVVVGHRWVNEIFSSMLGFGFENKSTSSNRVPESGNVTKEEAHDTLLHIEFKIGLLF